MNPISNTILGGVQAPRRRVKYVGAAGDILLAWTAVCFDHDNSTVASRTVVVETPSIANIRYPAGVITDTSAMTVDASGEAWIEIIPFNNVEDFPNVPLYTDMSITAGDLLAPQPGTRTLRRGALFGYAFGRATETVDLSSTAGTVTTVFRPAIRQQELITKHHVIEDDFKSYVTAHEGLTISLGGAATAVAANSALTIATDATDNVQGIISSTISQFAPATNRPAYLEGLITPTESAATAGNFFFGLHDGTIGATIPVTAANALASTNESYTIFICLVGAAVWSFATNDDGATATTTATTVAFGSAVAKKFGILWDGKTTWYGFINDVLVATHTTDLPTGKNLKFVTGVLSAGGIEQSVIDYFRLVVADAA